MPQHYSVHVLIVLLHVLLQHRISGHEFSTETISLVHSFRVWGEIWGEVAGKMIHTRKMFFRNDILGVEEKSHEGSGIKIAMIAMKVVPCAVY